MTTKEIKSFVTRILKENDMKITQKNICVSSIDFIDGIQQDTEIEFLLFRDNSTYKKYEISKDRNTDKFNIKELILQEVQAPELQEEELKEDIAVSNVEPITTDSAIVAPRTASDIITTVENNQEYAYQFYTTMIKNEYAKVSNSSLEIASLLLTVYETEVYRNDYSNIYEYASDKFGIARGTTNNFINVMKRFGKPSRIDSYNNQRYEISTQAQNYNMTQLILLTYLSDIEIMNNELTPEVSSREMKKRINELHEHCANALTDKQLVIDEKEELQENEENEEDSTPGTDDSENTDNEDNTNYDTVTRATFDIASYYDICKNKSLIEAILKNKNGAKWRIELVLSLIHI